MTSQQSPCSCPPLSRPICAELAQTSVLEAAATAADALACGSKWAHTSCSEEGERPEVVALLLAALLLQGLARLQHDGDGGDHQHSQGDL